MANKAKKKKPTNKLNVGANLTIEEVKEIHQQLQLKIKKKSDILIHSNQLEAIDLTGIQLLFWAKSQAALNKCKLVLECKPTESVLDIVEKSGFSELFEGY